MMSAMLSILIQLSHFLKADQKKKSRRLTISLQQTSKDLHYTWEILSFFFLDMSKINFLLFIPASDALMLSCQMPLEQVLSGMELSDPSEI